MQRQKWAVYVAAMMMVGIAGACSDSSTTAPRRLAPTGPQRLEACDEYNPCDDGGGGGGYIPPDTVDHRTYLQWFEMSDNDYYEIRQNFRDAAGNWMGYNSQKWHGYQHAVGIPIFDMHPSCNNGYQIEVEVYDISYVSGPIRISSFWIHNSDRDVRVPFAGANGSGVITYHWNANDPC